MNISRISLRVGGKLCLLIGLKSLSLLRSRHKNPPHMPLDLTNLMITFASCFTMGKAHTEGDILEMKCRAILGYRLLLLLLLGLLSLGIMPPTLGLFPTHSILLSREELWNFHIVASSNQLA
jgi:hypothetical protein